MTRTTCWLLTSLSGCKESPENDCKTIVRHGRRKIMAGKRFGVFEIGQISDSGSRDCATEGR